MPRKTKSKQRLDKYYNLAKDQGYRSRAAFKLLQLNRKYQFLSSANSVVDLCAAPGGWMQVCSKVMPSNSNIIGLDLVSIRPIPGCRSFQMDITTPDCVQLIKRELRGGKADVFLHDGAPNVGANWSKDAYNQNDLVLSSLKLATTFLKKGGFFITKVFRSADYNSLMWVFNKFFSKVEATKPLASRFVSAEIFVVGLDYLAPEYIDERLFETKHVFKDSEADMIGNQIQKEITSIDKLLQKRRRRGGYEDDAPQTVYPTLPFEEFMLKPNPYPVFLQYNKISMDEPTKEKYLPLCKPPADLEILFDDIQVLGRREIQQILKWRSKLKHLLQKSKATSVKALDQEDQEEWESEQLTNEEEEEEGEEVVEDIVEKQNEELEKKDLRVQKQELKEQRKSREKRINQEKKLTGKGSVGLGWEENQELFDIFRHKKLRNAGYTEIGEEVIEAPKKDSLAFSNQKELNDNLEQLYEQKQAKRKAGTERGKLKRQARKNQNVEQEYSEVDDDELACRPLKKQKLQKKNNKLINSNNNDEIQDALNNRRFFDRPIFQELKEQLGETVVAQESSTFVNPLKHQKTKEKVPKEKKQTKEKKKPQQDDNSDDDEEPQVNAKLLQKQVQFDMEQDDDYYIDPEAEFQKLRKVKIDQKPFPDEDRKVREYELNLPISEMEKRRRKLKKLASKEEARRKVKEDPNMGDFDVVPMKRLEDYDIDDLATNLALAKKMLRKKTRDQIIENSFNRYSWEDHDFLPSWFADDEKEHSYKMTPVTKEEFQQEKQRLYEINSRVPKKVMEAKIRKYKKAQKKFKKAAQKSQSVFDQEGVSEKLKLQQVQKIYKKEQHDLDREKQKKYIVGKKGSGKGPNKGSRYVKMVDKRMKKDTRAQKVNELRRGSKKIKKKRQTKRHQGKKSKS